MTKVKTPDEFFNSLSADESVDVKKESVDDLLKEEFGEEVSGTEIELDIKDEEDVEETAKADSSEEEEAEEAGKDDEGSEGQEGSVDDELFEFESESDGEEAFNISSIAKEIGLSEEVKDKESFVNSYKKSLEKAKEDALADIPEKLREAIEFSKQGGDYNLLLEAGSIDYDKTSSKDLVKASVQKYFKDDDGNLDKEALEEWFESKSKAEINIMGDQIREKMKFEQTQKINSIKESLSKEKEKSNAALKEYISRMDSIGGVKLGSAEKEALYNDTVAGVAIREMFYGEDGKISQKKLAENLFKVRKFEKAIYLAKANAKTDGKREVLSKVTNSTVKKPAGVTKSETKNISPLESFYNILANKS